MRRRTFILSTLALLLSGRDSPEKGVRMNLDMAKEQELDRQLLRELLFEVDIDGTKYSIGQPSPGRYRGEDYGWDPAFFIHSLLAVGEKETALRMMDGVAKKIALAGYLPLVARWNPKDHDLVWKLRTKGDPRFTAEIQPPLIAQTALHLVREVGFDNLERGRVLEWTRSAQTNVDWLMEHRRDEGRKLLFVIDPIETGEDSLSAWDQIAAEKGWGILPRAIRIFWLPFKLNADYIRQGWDLERIEANSGSVLIEPVSLNVLAIREMLVLAVLWRMLANSAEGKRLEEMSRAQTEALEILWNEEAGSYFPAARFGTGEWRQMTTYSVESLYPLLLPDLPVERVGKLVQLIEREFVPQANFLLPVAPVDPRHPQKVAGVVPIWWPGQVWANTDWFNREALDYQARRLTGNLRQQALELSARIDLDWRHLKEESGYAEFYFQDGRGGAEQKFFWSCLRRAKFRVEI